MLCSCVTAPVLLYFYPFYREKGLTVFLSGSITEQGKYYPDAKQKHEAERSADFTWKGVSLWTVQTVMVDYGTHMDDMECSSYTPEGTVAFLCAISISFPFAIAEKTG